MSDEAERFNEEIDRLLDGDTPGDGAGNDPLLHLAVGLRAALDPVPPAADFRARLKAELLERYADNVRPFPTPTLVAPPPKPSAWRRARHAAIAVAAAAAASLALVFGYDNLHRQPGSPPTVSQGFTSTPMPTATLPPASPTPPPPTAVPQNGMPGNGDSPNGVVPPHRHHLTPALSRPTATATGPAVVAQNLTPTASDTPLPPDTATVPPDTATPPHATAILPAPTATLPMPAGPTAPAPSATLPAPTATRVPPTATHVPPASPTAGGNIVVEPTTPPTSTPTAVPRTDTPVPPTDTPVRPTATLVPSTSTAVPTRIHQNATTPRHPSATPVPTHRAATPTRTQRPQSQATSVPVPPTATATPPAATATLPVATATTVPPTSTPVLPSATHPPPPSATAPPTSTSVPVATDTPVPAVPTSTPTTAIPPTEAATQVANNLPSVTVTPGRVPATSAGVRGGTATPTPTAGLTVPAPLPANAGGGSPLGSTRTYAPAVTLGMPAAPAPAPAAQIAVFTPVTGQGSALDTLKSVLHLRPDVIKVQSRSRVVALVHVDNRVYNADLQPRSYGYHLSMRLVTAVPPAPALAPSFDAVGYADTFLNARGLGGAYQNPAITQSGSTISVALTQQSGSYALSGAQAVLTFDTRGVLLSADVRWVDTTSAPLANSITPDTALQEVAAGHGLISIGGGVVPDPNSSVTGTTIVYVPVNAPDGTYYEPVYQFTCVTGGGVPFQVYVPALDRMYLR